MLKNIYKIVHIRLCKTAGFTIIGHGYNKRHYTMSEREAFEWLGCYKHASLIVQGLIVATHKH